MNKIYQVRVLKGDTTVQGSTISASTSVYANSELEARIQGAEQLGVQPDQVQVDLIPGVGNPTDNQLKEMWSDVEDEIERLKNLPPTGGGAYGR